MPLTGKNKFVDSKSDCIFAVAERRKELDQDVRVANIKINK